MKSTDSDLISFTQGAVFSAAAVGILGAAFSSLRAFRENIPIFAFMMLILSSLSVSIYSVIVIIENRLQPKLPPSSCKAALWFGLGICPFALVLLKAFKNYPLDPFQIYIVGIVAYVLAARYVSNRKRA